METKVIIRQCHTHDVSIKMLAYVVYNHIELFENEEGDNISITHEFPNTIGKTTCIDTDLVENPDIYYTTRGNRKYLSRMIRGVEAQSCSCITMVIRKYRWEYKRDVKLLFVYVVTSYIGKKAPKEYAEIQYKRSIGHIDFTQDEENEAADFWSHYALLEEL